MKFKPGEKIKALETTSYDYGNIIKGQIYTFERYEVMDYGLYIKRRIPKNIPSGYIEDYNWFDRDCFISAEPELFHQQLENLINET